MFENFSALKKEDLLEAVNKIEILDSDIEVINNLIDFDERFFVRVFEEVVRGNLFFSDFLSALENTVYSKVLEKNIEGSAELEKEINKFIALRKELYDEVNLNKWKTGVLEKPENNLALMPAKNDNSYNNSLFEAEVASKKARALSEIFEISGKDTDLVLAAKTKFLETISELSNNSVTAEDQLNNLMTSIRENAIPIDYRYQELDTTDFEFMRLNNITEDEMKKIKSLTLFLKRGH